VAPLVDVARKILAAGTRFSETSMAGHLGVLAAGPAVATTEVGDVDGVTTTKVGDVDGGPLGGC
jgi:hypothetical protein